MNAGPLCLSCLYLLEVEADAESELSDGAGGDSACVDNGFHGFIKGLVGLVGIADDVLAEAVVIDTGADVAAEIGTEADHPGEGYGGLVGIGVGLIGNGYLLAADKEEVAADSELQA